MMSLKEWLAFWLEEIKTPMLGETTYDNYKSFIDRRKEIFRWNKVIIKEN